LQTPQYFNQTKEKHSENEVEFGGGNVVEEFYNLDQVSRDRFEAAICVGTSAVYRREAILSVGGTPKVNYTEDVRTGLSITQTGYKVKYIPLIISIGKSPDTLQGYFRQHNRWCSGSITLLSDYYLKSKLSFIGKLIYLMNPIYYISEALVPIIVFHFIILFIFNSDTLLIYNSIYFVPKIFYEIIFMPVIMRNHRTRKGTKLAAMNNIFTYFYTIFIDMLSKNRLQWHPAGVSIEGVGIDFRKVVRIGIIFSLLYIFSAIFAFTYKREYLLDLNSSIVVIWIVYNALSYMIYFVEATRFLKFHDTKYRHPSNIYITKFRNNWAHVKHILVPSSVFILFISLILNIYIAFGTK
jgi:hypothetical protein